MKGLFIGCGFVLSVFAGWSCSSHQDAAGPVVASGETEPKEVASTSKPVVDDCGNYQPDVELPVSRCESDDDCVATPLRPGDCTKPLCSGHYRAGTKDWVAALEEMHARVCGDAKWKICKRVKCLHRKPEGARCAEGACKPVFPAE